MLYICRSLWAQVMTGGTTSSPATGIPRTLASRYSTLKHLKVGNSCIYTSHFFDSDNFICPSWWHFVKICMYWLWLYFVSDTRVFMTIAVDLVIEGIQEPVRFLIETKAKIFPTNERFWYFTKKPLQECFLLKIAQVRIDYFCCLGRRQLFLEFQEWPTKVNGTGTKK